ncbi:MAG TPA: 30S ribosomal protein S5 [Spirochaetia bacterium]|nr:MAG: 30S ribosomal protein S5 [Spirochaetes bacterium GWB1_36_13]HCL57323.1 30S ribosomal protein S5 [Spirochaetia bacterium]
MAKSKFDREKENEALESGLQEELIHLNRIVKVTKGGRKFRFAALVAVGDNEGKVGLGYGKSKEVPDAIKKAANDAKKNMVGAYLKNQTVGHPIIGKFRSTTVLLKPARPGTGIIAGGIVRSIVSKIGINDLLSKVYGRKNPLNVAKATLEALKNLTNPLDIAKKRGKSVREIFQ